MTTSGPRAEPSSRVPRRATRVGPATPPPGRTARPASAHPTRPAAPPRSGQAATARRRAPLLVAGPLVVAAGLTVSTVGSGLVADLLGDALYAALVWVVLAALAVRWSTPMVTAAAFGVCAVIELAQLSGVPAAVTAAWSPARYLLGTTFAAPDLLAYAVGALTAGALAAGASAVAAGAVRTGGRADARPRRHAVVPHAPREGGASAGIPLRVDPARGGSQGKA